MSQGEELLNGLTEEEVAAYTVDSDSEPHIVINSDRSITVPDELKRIAVQFDCDVETVTFDCPRYWDDIDMSEMNVYINYRLPNGELGSYPVKQVTIDAENERIMHFDWTISANVTQYIGNLMFLVCAKSVDANGDEEYHWNSELNKDMYISEGLECEENPLEPYPDLVTHMLTRMRDIEDGLPSTITVDNIEGGHRVTVNVGEKSTSFVVMDGEKGDPGTGFIDHNSANPVEIFVGTKAEWDAYAGDKTNMLFIPTDDNTIEEMVDRIENGDIAVARSTAANGLDIGTPIGGSRLPDLIDGTKKWSYISGVDLGVALERGGIYLIEWFTTKTGLASGDSANSIRRSAVFTFYDDPECTEYVHMGEYILRVQKDSSIGVYIYPVYENGVQDTSVDISNDKLSIYKIGKITLD